MRLTRLLVPLVLLGGLTSCGTDAPPPQQVVALAPAATLRAATAQLDLVMDFADVPGANGARLEGAGAVDFTHGRYAAALDLRDLVGRGVDATLEARQDGTTLYLRLPSAGWVLPGVARDDWVALDLQALGRTGNDLTGGLGLDANDPRQGLALLEGASKGGVRAMGEDDVRGVHTTRYRADVDLAEVVAGSGAGLDPKALRAFVDRLSSDTVTVTVWVDDDGLVRRLRLPMPLPVEAGGGTMVVTTEYHDFGAAVDVAPPDPAHVVDMTHRVDELFSGTGG